MPCANGRMCNCFRHGNTISTGRSSRWPSFLLHDGDGLPCHRFRALARHELRAAGLGASTNEPAGSADFVHSAAARLVCSQYYHKAEEGRLAPQQQVKADADWWLLAAPVVFNGSGYRHPQGRRAGAPMRASPPTIRPHPPAPRGSRGDPWSPMTSWRWTGGTCWLRLSRSAGSGWASCSRLAARRWGEASKPERRSPEIGLQSFVMLAGWTSKASSPSASTLGRWVAERGHGSRPRTRISSARGPLLVSRARTPLALRDWLPVLHGPVHA